MSDKVEQAILALLKRNPKPEDEEVHALAGKLGMDPDDLEEKVYAMLARETKASKADKIPGGLADKKDTKDFDPKQIAMGIKVELEHTNDRKIAEEIARDHLTEDPAYYTHLKEMEDKYSKKSGTEDGFESLEKFLFGGKKEGSRGGQVIGHTAAGNPIYASKKKTGGVDVHSHTSSGKAVQMYSTERGHAGFHEKMKQGGWSKKDHDEASDIHDKLARHHQKQGHKELAARHRQMRDYHNQSYNIARKSVENDMQKAATCPGGKIRSQGQGRGMGRGEGQGPMGKPPFGKADDGKPGESLEETSTDELKATHQDIQARLKQKPDDSALQARSEAIGAELKRRGGMSKSDAIHSLGDYLEKALPKKGKPGGTVGDKPPKEYREGGATSKKDYADPANFKYPIDTEAHVRAAISYFSKPKNAGVYSSAEQKSIWGRIKHAAKKYGIELSESSGPPSVEKAQLPSASADITPEKAREILHHGEVHGKPITEQQRKFFGAIGGHLPAPGSKKSMSLDELPPFIAHEVSAALRESLEKADANDTLGEYLEKAGVGTMKKAQSMPTGGPEPDLLDWGTEDGQKLDGLGKPGESPPSTSGKVDMGDGPSTPEIALSEDDNKVADQLTDKPKPLWSVKSESGYTRQELEHTIARDKALYAQEMQKSDDVTVGVGVQSVDQPVSPTLQTPTTIRKGMLTMDDRADLDTEAFIKSGAVIHGERVSGGPPNALMKSNACPRGHQSSAMLTSCPDCGLAKSGGLRPSNAQALVMEKSGGGGLRPHIEADLVLPNGTLIEEE